MINQNLLLITDYYCCCYSYDFVATIAKAIDITVGISTHQLEFNQCMAGPHFAN